MDQLFNLTLESPDGNGTADISPSGGHPVWQVVIIVLLTGMLSLITIIGNILVVVSFKVNHYVASNASVMNLLVISFDRYFSVTRPLTYRAKRTTKRAAIMIGLAWVVSLVLWAPAILLWQYLEGKRTVPSHMCYIQFLSEPTITFCTAMAAFYLPVTIMSVLYWRIYKETQNRSKELAGLQGSGLLHQKGSSRSCSSYELTRLSKGKRACGELVSGLRCWPGMRSWRPGSTRRGEGDPDQSSSDSWNNNDAAVSLDHSASSDDEDCGGREMIPQSHAIFSIVLSLPGIKAAVNSQLTSCEDLDAASEEDALQGSEYNRDSLTRETANTTTMTTSDEANSQPTNAKCPSASISFKEAAIAKRFAARARNQITKRKRMSLVKEKKAAQTLSAILFAFIITWTPYNIMVLINAFCKGCIPETLWAVGYWLCYVNSTVNPMCYALCNKTFRTTFKMILLCRWDQKKRRKQQFEERHSVIFHRRIPREST
uniref:Muscarinic acetylcholine receptor n=1 Tax=Cynoglossus semilaevis TaxID=244447 RepID=A0A3P8V0V7_CYNSE